MRWLIVLLAALGCGNDGRGDTNDAAPDGNPVVDSGTPSLAPAFVRNFFLDCGSVQERCTRQTPGPGTGTILLVTITYSPQTAHAVSVTDEGGQLFQRAIDPIPWAAGDGDSQTELWWGRRGLGTTAVHVNVSEQVSINVYVSEFAATAVDQVAAFAGKANNSGVFSSRTRTITHVPQLIFGHGEGRNALVSPGAGFTQRVMELGNIEETKVAEIPGEYEAPFMLDRGGHWVALMATLR